MAQTFHPGGIHDPNFAGFNQNLPTGKQERTLIDIAQSRPDVMAVAQKQGGDPFTGGTAANRWLNDWWNTAGVNEFPDVTLVQPGQQPTAPIQAPGIGEDDVTPVEDLGDKNVQFPADQISDLQSQVNDLTELVRAGATKTPEQEAAEEEEKGILKTMKDMIKSPFDAKEDLKKERIEAGATPELQAEMDSLESTIAAGQGRIDKIQAERLIQEEAIRAQKGTLGISDQSQIDRLNRDTKNRVLRITMENGANARLLAVKQGKFDMANRLAKELTDLAIEAEQQEYERLLDYKDANQDFIDRMDKESRQKFEDTIKAKEFELTTAADRIKSIGDLQMQVPNIQLDFTKSYEDNLQMALPELRRQQADVLGGGGGAIFEDTETGETYDFSSHADIDKFIAANKDMTDEELRVFLQRNATAKGTVKLGQSEITALIKNRIRTMSDEDVIFEAENLIADNFVKKVFTGRAGELTDAKKLAIESIKKDVGLTLEIDGKKITLTEDIINKIIQEINSITDPSVITNMLSDREKEEK